MKGTLSKRLLHKQAKRLGHADIAARLAADPNYANKLARVPDNRISHLRTQKRLEKKSPYEHPIFIEVIASCFFRGPDSIASKWASMFSSSHPDLPDELEVPPPMVALVATAVHNALSEWRTGVHRSIPFHGAVHEEQYRGHLDILEGIKSRSLRAYHAMMHRLYTAASSSSGTTADASESNPNSTIEMIEILPLAPGMNHDDTRMLSHADAPPVPLMPSSPAPASIAPPAPCNCSVTRPFAFIQALPYNNRVSFHLQPHRRPMLLLRLLV
ncbi:hypothetical protein NUW54_g5857 [Trametes sanguinea]|uniref:Uncharacterized protein n=1 Tax=Trametes sanguinea TaxID=158606 RepID=A0ACC1PWX2_9APHY|nr:hypothetical protein NUW54_g5857 [Trametes sanguinea]